MGHITWVLTCQPSQQSINLNMWQAAQDTRKALMRLSAVQTINNLLKKAADTYHALLACRSTPLSNSFSPAQLLLGHHLCTTVPAFPAMSSHSGPAVSPAQRKGKEKDIGEQLWPLTQSKDFLTWHQEIWCGLHIQRLQVLWHLHRTHTDPTWSVDHKALVGGNATTLYLCQQTTAAIHKNILQDQTCRTLQRTLIQASGGSTTCYNQVWQTCHKARSTGPVRTDMLKRTLKIREMWKKEKKKKKWL